MELDVDGAVVVVVVGVSHGFEVADVDGCDVVVSVVVGAVVLDAGFEDVSVVEGAGLEGQSPELVVVVVVLGEVDGVEDDVEPVVVVVDEAVVVVVVVEEELEDGSMTAQACWTTELTTVLIGADALVELLAADVQIGELDVELSADARDGAAIIAPPAAMTLAVKIPVMRLVMVSPRYTRL